jgi:hypothetical protein
MNGKVYEDAAQPPQVVDGGLARLMFRLAQLWQAWMAPTTLTLVVKRRAKVF